MHHLAVVNVSGRYTQTQKYGNNVDGWEDMTERVKQDIVDLDIVAITTRYPPIMTVEDNTIGDNLKNPQLLTMRLMRTFSSSQGHLIKYMVGRLATVLKGSGG